MGGWMGGWVGERVGRWARVFDLCVLVPNAFPHETDYLHPSIRTNMTALNTIPYTEHLLHNIGYVFSPMTAHSNVAASQNS